MLHALSLWPLRDQAALGGHQRPQLALLAGKAGALLQGWQAGPDVVQRQPRSRLGQREARSQMGLLLHLLKQSATAMHVQG